MRRKNNNRTDKPMHMAVGIPEKLPFQNKYSPINISGLEAAKAALPIFGGTGPTNSESSSSGDGQPSSTTDKKDETNSAGGDSGQPDPNQLTPEQIADVLKQVQTLTTTSQELQNELSTYKSKEEDARKAALGREEAQAEELQKAHETIAAMDQIIKNLALVNAIQSDPDVQFHDVDFVLTKLDENGYEFDMDMDAKKAKVKGLNTELKRIARENEWAVKNLASQQQGNSGTKKPPAKATGAPPSPSATNGGKANTREALMARFPAIGAGRSRTAIPR